MAERLETRDELLLKAESVKVEQLDNFAWVNKFALIMDRFGRIGLLETGNWLSLSAKIAHLNLLKIRFLFRK